MNYVVMRAPCATYKRARCSLPLRIGSVYIQVPRINLCLGCFSILDDRALHFARTTYFPTLVFARNNATWISRTVVNNTLFGPDRSHTRAWHKGVCVCV